ncbi:MAG: DUF2283 domain-containing protein [Burkholderiales bacterium]|nr:DUF2283 domain-containing protein [Burkholderiales bacterium]
MFSLRFARRIVVTDHAAKRMAARHVSEAELLAVIDTGETRHAGGLTMRTTYYDKDDILVIRLSDKPIVREVSQDWNTHVSYAEDGTAVEIVVLDARASGAMPMEVNHASAA